MIPLLAAILLAGAAGAGPVLVSDACGSDTTTNDDLARGRCAVEAVSRNMKAKERPAELKVEAEGKLYSVPEGVEMLTPPPQGELDQWWKEFFRKFREFCSVGANKAKVVGSDSARPSGDAAGDQGNSSQSDSDNGGDGDGDGDGTQGEAAVANKDVRSAGEHSCQICFDQDHSTVMLPCGHGGLCWDCGLQIYALTEECPMCRTKIELLVQLDGEKRRYEGEDEYVSALCA
ncbi:unnamed protein product [Ectocarpus sp. 8 AP-2014]